VDGGCLTCRALEKLYLIGTQKEDEFTNYINIGPVNQMINTLCVFLKKGKSSSEFANHLYRIDDYLWMGRDGMKMNGTNGSQLWDCAFAVQALIENPRVRDEFKVGVKLLCFGASFFFCATGQGGMDGL
jgi:lanosterol synthase